jgi:hypothetical protein
MSDDGIPLFRVDKEAMVIDLYRQGKRQREIASIVRMSFSDIKTILDREFGSKEQKKGQRNEESLYSKALKLFLSGKKPVDVAIKLQMGYEDVRRTYLQFLSLNRMQKLRNVYNELGDEGLKSLLSMHNKMKENGLTFEQMEQAVYYTDSAVELDQRNSILTEEVNELHLKRGNLVSANQNLESMIKVSKRNLQSYNNEIEIKQQELMQLSQEVNLRKNFVQNFDNEEGIARIKGVSRQEIELVMKNNQALFAFTIAALFETLRRYPAGQDLLLQLLMPDSTNPYQQFSIDMHKNELLELGTHIQYEIIERISKNALDSVEQIPRETL